jgi:hypothetical protein
MTAAPPHVLLREGPLVHLLQGLPGRAAEQAEQLPVLAEDRPEHLGDGKDDLPIFA